MNRRQQIAAGLHQVRARIADAEARAGRAPGAVRLVAVSKRMPLADIRAALDVGQRDFGENYAQELRDKRGELDGPAADRSTPGETESTTEVEGARWHYLGPLQRNKVKYLAGQVALIHSLDDADTLAEIERRAAILGTAVAQPCLVQVNIAGEAGKGGVPPHRLPNLLDRFASTPHATCVGLMLIPPFSKDAAATRRHFAGLRELAEREARVNRPNIALAELSMGMSGDFEEAIAEGATIVRVGTAIFGDRSPR